MNKKIILIIITIIVGLVGMLVLISGLFNKKQPTILDDTTTTIELEVIKTNIPRKQKKAKKVVKTSKKTTKKKVSAMNVKASKSEMQEYAYQRVVQIWGKEHWDSFYQLVSHESGWNPNSVNKKTNACGLFQFVPCSKGGKAYKTDYKVQIEKGIQYISARYGNPNKAWSFWKQHHWY